MRLPEKGRGQVATAAGWACALACLLAALALPLSSAAAAELATVTLVEGQPSILRGPQRLLLAPGAALLPDDIVETGTGGFVQAEAADGSTLGLGPGTRLLLDAGRGGPAVPYLLSGWAKVVMPAGSRGTLAHALRLARVDLSDIAGAVVVNASGADVRVFCESAEAAVLERDAGRAPLRLKPGQYWSSAADARGRAAPRPDAAFMAAMPVVFRDTLPSMLARVAGRKPVLKPVAAPTYAELEPWFTLDEPALRARFVQRFGPRLEDPAFRRAVQGNLARHPEWQASLASFKNP